MALLLSLFSFADRARSWPPRAPLDFPEPSPYPQPSIAVGCLVWLATTPSAESRYLSALTLLAAFTALPGPPDSAENLTGFRTAVTRAAATRSSAGYLSPPDLVGATLWILTVVNTASVTRRLLALNDVPLAERTTSPAEGRVRLKCLRPMSNDDSKIKPPRGKPDAFYPPQHFFDGAAGPYDLVLPTQKSGQGVTCSVATRLAIR